MARSLSPQRAGGRPRVRASTSRREPERISQLWKMRVRHPRTVRHASSRSVPVRHRSPRARSGRLQGGGSVPVRPRLPRLGLGATGPPRRRRRVLSLAGSHRAAVAVNSGNIFTAVQSRSVDTRTSPAWRLLAGAKGASGGRARRGRRSRDRAPRHPAAHCQLRRTRASPSRGEILVQTSTLAACATARCRTSGSSPC